MVWKGNGKDRLAQSLVVLIDAIDKKFPKRDKRNDGTIGDEAHKKKGAASDHNPHIKKGSAGIVTALDITHDPGAGFDALAFADSLRAAKDKRIKYVIFNGRIFSSTESPWMWRNRGKGSGDHSEHVHVSVVDDPALYDSEDPWPFDMPDIDPDQTEPTEFRPKLKIGDSGPSVVELQTRLGISADGEFGPDTDAAVRAFQASRNILADGIVGPHTWGLLLETPAPAPPKDNAALAAATIDKIAQLAAGSSLAKYSWLERGQAPVGYIKGMAVMFAHVYVKLKNGDPAAKVMAAAVQPNAGETDALAWYDAQFRDLNMDNSSAGGTTLRHLFVLMLGLGMRESSGKYFCGRDGAASNTTADTAEAGLFQMSWNMRSASAEIPRLFAAYSAKPDGYLSIFKDGTPAPKASDLEDHGSGEGVAYQKLAKSCPAFAVETAAVGLRVRRRHWGPINNHHAEVLADADNLLRETQALVDAAGAVVVAPSEQDTQRTKPNLQPLLALILSRLLKEKTMADPSTAPASNVDLAKILQVVLEAAAAGKPVDAGKILAGVSGETPGIIAPVQPPSQNDEISKLIQAVIALVLPKVDPAKALPVTNALGTTIGNLLNGKKSAIGIFGALGTSLLSALTTAPAGGEITALGKALLPLIPAAGLSGFAMPIFIAMTVWGLASKAEKWSKQIAASK